MSNWLWVCPGFPSIWKFSWIKTWTRHLSFSLSNWLKTSLKEWLKRCSVPVWSSSDSLWADLSRAQGAGGWPMNGILAAFLRHIWTIVELENLGLMDWKPWVPRFADSSRFPLDFMICSVRQNVFFSLSGSLLFFSLSGSLWHDLARSCHDWAPAANTGALLIAYPFSFKAMAESKCFAFAFQLKWLGGEPNTSQGFNAGLALHHFSSRSPKDLGGILQEFHPVLRFLVWHLGTSTHPCHWPDN